HAQILRTKRTIHSSSSLTLARETATTPPSARHVNRNNGYTSRNIFARSRLKLGFIAAAGDNLRRTIHPRTLPQSAWVGKPPCGVQFPFSAEYQSLAQRLARRRLCLSSHAGSPSSRGAAIAASADCLYFGPA